MLPCEKQEFEVLLVAHKSEVNLYREVLVDEIVCFLYFLYLTSGMEEAQKVFNQNQSWVKNKMARNDHELLYCGFVKLAYLHVRHNVTTPPRFLRNLLLASLEEFPDNTVSFGSWLLSRLL